MSTKGGHYTKPGGDDQESSIRHFGGSLSQMDDRASKQLVELLQPDFLRFASRFLRDIQSAEDAVQETFLALFSSSSQPPPGADLRAWGFTILGRKCIDSRRKAKLLARAALDNAIVDSCPSKGSATGHGATVFCREVSKASMQQLDVFISGLSKLEQQILLLQYKHDMSLKEIAKALDHNHQYVKNVSSECRQKRCTFIEQADPDDREAIKAVFLDRLAEIAGSFLPAQFSSP